MMMYMGNLKNYRRIYYKRYMGLPLDIVQYIDMFGQKIEFNFYLN